MSYQPPQGSIGFQSIEQELFHDSNIWPDNCERHPDFAGEKALSASYGLVLFVIHSVQPYN